MKAMSSLRGMTVIIAAVILITTIFAIPVPNASAADTVAQQSQTYADVSVGPLGRYVLRGTVSGIYNQNEGVWFSDQYGEDWVFYGFCPLQRGENATLVINSNVTTNDFSDDFIEDVLWSDCTETD